MITYYNFSIKFHVSIVGKFTFGIFVLINRVHETACLRLVQVYNHASACNASRRLADLESKKWIKDCSTAYDQPRNLVMGLSDRQELHQILIFKRSQSFQPPTDLPHCTFAS